MSDKFDQFWSAWPSPQDQQYRDYKRKTDKKKCSELWDKHRLDEKFEVIIRDVELRKKYDKGWLQQQGEFLSAPLVYLRNERWDGSEFADVRDDRKRAAATQAKPFQSEDTGPAVSRYGRYANLYLLKELLRIGGLRDDGLLGRIVEAKNEVVSMAEQDGDWMDDDFKSVIAKTVSDALVREAV